MLLQRIAAALENDPRIVAAWLFGSLGRGKSDGLSDLDIFVIMDDAHIEAVCATRREFVAPFGSLLCTVDAPQNGPRGGGYLMALYAGSHGPHQADWYWQAQSRAKIPQQTILLFDKVGLPRDDRPTTFDDMNPSEEREPIAAVSNTLCGFWAMLCITAKYAFRKPDAERMELLPYVQNPLREVTAFAGVPVPSAAEDTAPHPAFADKIFLLRTLAQIMETILPQAAKRGVLVPSAIAPQAHLFLDFIQNAHLSTTEESHA